MATRRDAIKLLGAAAAASVIPNLSCSDQKGKAKHQFRYCLNTSTIRGQNPGLAGAIEIAAQAGYDGVELWVDEIKSYLEEGNRLGTLKSIIDSAGIKVEGAIGFAPWIAEDKEIREKGLIRLEEEMNIMAGLECKRIAAPPAGFQRGTELDYQKVAERYGKVLDLGRKTGVMPHLEFWGGSPGLYTLGQALNVAAVTNDPDVRILGDVYQFYRGGSGFHGLKIISGTVIEIFHMNDYPGDIARDQLTDADRIYPGDGAAPSRELISDLHEMGGVKVLSLELFNRDYWEQDALEVAETGLRKMKDLVDSATIL